MFKCNFMCGGRAISCNLGGMFCQIFYWYAPRKPMVALRLDSVEAYFEPPPHKFSPAYTPPAH